MLIQYILVLFSIALLVLFLRKRGTSKSAAGVKLAFMLFVVFGVYAVLRPGDVTVIAGWLGVGRGADLLLYALVVVFTFATLNAYLRFKELELRYARLARAIALRQAEAPEPPAGHSIAAPPAATPTTATPAAEHPAAAHPESQS